MSAHDDGGPAFPVVADQYDYGFEKEMPKSIAAGMTLRDFFAAKALAGTLAYFNPHLGDAHTNSNPTDVAASAYVYADAMLKARKA